MQPPRPPAWRAPAVVRTAVDAPVPGGIRLAPGLALVASDPVGWPEVSGVGDITDRVLAVHGSGVVDGRFVTDSAGLQAVLDAHPTWTSDELGSSIRGVMTAYVWRPGDAAVDVLPDPWGGLVHRYADNGVEVVSSDLGRVVEVLTSLGLRPRKSLPFAAEVASLGSGGYEPSSYEGIDVLDVFQYLRITADRVEVHRYGVGDEVLTPFASYAEGLDAISAEIEGNLRAVAAAAGGDDRVVAHLTGGIDTRLVLAATRALGLTDGFRYLCMGPHSSSDHRIAVRLAVEFDLLMTDDQGTGIERSPETFGDQLLWPMRHSWGLTPGGPTAHRTGTDTILLAGGFGGYLKGNYSRASGADDVGPGRDDSAAVAQAVFGVKAFSSEPGAALVAPDVMEHRIDRFHALRLAAADLGLSPSAALDWLFIRVRNRYFVAETTRLWNSYVHRFDPLYSVSGARLALSLPTDERAANRVPFDLMRRWTPRLLGLPFDRPRVTPAYEALSRGVRMREFARPDKEPRHDGRRPPYLPPATGVTPVPPVSPELVERARAMDAPLRLLRDLDEARDLVRSCLDQLPAHQRWEVLNKSTVHGLLNYTLTHRGPIRQVHSLAAALVWYTDGMPARAGAGKPEPVRRRSLAGTRKVLWHLRNGGVRQAREAYRRQR